MQNVSWKLLACILVCVSAFAARADAENVVVKHFENGAGSNAVGVADASEDTEIDGPQALTSGDNGDLFLLDQVNGRILRFDPRQPTTAPHVLALPTDVQPTDLVVRKSDILVWDGSVRTLKASGGTDDGASYRGLEETSTRDADDPYVLSAFSQMGTQTPGSSVELLNPETRAVASKQPRARSRQYIASRGHGPVIVDVIPEAKNAAAAHIEVSVQGETSAFAKLRIEVANRLGAVEFLEIDNNGRMYVLGEDIPPQADKAVSFVARYSDAGVLEGIYELPFDSDVPLTRRFVTVSGDGDVYFLRTQRTGVEVVGVGFRTAGKSKVISVRPPQSALRRFASLNGPVAAVRPVNRQNVIENAFAFEGIQWKLTPTAYGRDPDTACTGFHRVRRPGYLQGRVNQEVRGVPYCWGCFGTLTQIRAKIDRGVLAGNVCTHNEPRSDVAGVDCSAFVSAVWGLNTHFTTDAIPSIATQLENPWDLKPGDALDKPRSHVMLFLRFTPDRKVEVMESSTGACNGRVCRNVYPLASLLARGFRPVRFRALANDTTVVAQATQAAEPEENSHPRAQSHAKGRRHHH